MKRQIFAKYVLTDNKLKDLLEHRDFEKYKKIKQRVANLDCKLANKIASAMKNWAISNGATHYLHWFFPLTSNSAGKLVSFFDIDKSGEIIQKFDGNCLIKGETDASSFPSGNERMSFEARGYTIWDYSSPAFIKSDNFGNKVLCIPTAFCSYNGVALDEKTPLLRASEALSRELTEFLHTMGMKNVKSVVCNLGIEQEYFLIPTELYMQREDLVFTGRTLLSSPAIINQESEHHYFGNINSRVSNFMHELDQSLCKLGIIAKIQHSEVAPAQFEVVARYAAANISTDQNMLLMDTLNSVAERHNLKVLLHEKPFSSVNGSGKHNNWSFSTDTGINLLAHEKVEPNIFMAVFSSILSGISSHYDLFRLSTATLSNEQRLGGNEAPPATISVYVGSLLIDKMDKFLSGTSIKEPQKEPLNLKALRSIKLQKDDCDRNRTSPFAYTGDKFEFRMVGSSQNVAFCNTIFCTVVADEFKKINKKLSASKNVNEDLNKIIRENIKSSQKIIFNGNCYDKAWLTETKRRGIKSFDNIISCYECLKNKQNKKLLSSLGVMSEAEIQVRLDTELKAYFQSVIIEANTLCHIVKSRVLPSVLKFEAQLIELSKIQGEAKINNERVLKLSKTLNSAADKLDELVDVLNRKISLSQKQATAHKKALFASAHILPTLNQICSVYGEIEPVIPEKLKPFPDYNKLLFW